MASLKKGKEKNSTDGTTDEKLSKKQQKSKGPKIVEKFIGTLPVREDTKKLPKGLPSHWGAKVRHKPRPAVTSTNKKSKNQAVKRKAEEGSGVTGPQVSSYSKVELW